MVRPWAPLRPEQFAYARDVVDDVAYEDCPRGFLVVERRHGQARGATTTSAVARPASTDRRASESRRARVAPALTRA